MIALSVICAESFASLICKFVNKPACGMSAQGTNEIAEIVWNNPNNYGFGQTSEMFLVVFDTISFTIK